MFLASAMLLPSEVCRLQNLGKWNQCAVLPFQGRKAVSAAANLLDAQLLPIPDLQGWLMFPNKFKASLFPLFPEAICE